MHEGSEKRLVFRPHQTPTVSNPDFKYDPLVFRGDLIECVCPCHSSGLNVFDDLIIKRNLSNTILWIDPRFIPTECLASMIFSWDNTLHPERNISIGIVVTQLKAEASQNNHYLWKPGLNGAKRKKSPKNVIWYPSLQLDKTVLLKASQLIDPYDVYPVLDFSDSIMQPGDSDLTNHNYLLEATRTRTRHFIMFNPSHPERNFRDFYGTLSSTPRAGYISMNPVITPGGASINYLISTIAAVLSDSYLMTPLNEIPMNLYDDPQGIVLLRKCS